MDRGVWSQANVRLIPTALLFIVGIVLSSVDGNIRSHAVDRKLLAIIGVIIFVVFATAFLHIISKAIYDFITSNRLGMGRAASLQFILRTFGYIVIFVAALDLLAIPVERIILGSAVLGIILGVAAQQALANFFASIILIISHPFTIGEDVKLLAFGVNYNGTVVDIGLTHTHIREKNGELVLLPNAALLSNSAIMPQKHKKPSEEKTSDN